MTSETLDSDWDLKTKTEFDPNYIWNVLKKSYPKELETAIDSVWSSSENSKLEGFESVPKDIDNYRPLGAVRWAKKVGLGDVVLRRLPGTLLPPLKARLPMAALVNTTQTDRVFDELVLALPDGRIIYSSGNIATKFHDISPIISKRYDQNIRSVSSRSSRNSIDNKFFSSFGLTSAGHNAYYHSEKSEIKIGDINHLSFVHPVHPSLPSVDDSLKDDQVISIVGLVEESRFTEEAAILPLNTVAYIVIIFVAGVLSWPYIRLRLVPPGARLTVWDGHALVYCLIFGTVLVIMALAQPVRYGWLEGQFDNDARAVSQKIKQSFHSELSDALTEVDEIDLEKISSLNYSAGVYRSICETIHDFYAINTLQEKKESDPISDEYLWTLFSCVFPQEESTFATHELVFALDGDGDQFLSSLSRRSVGTQFISVPGRPYYQRSRNLRLWSGEVFGTRRPFFLERIITLDHGWPLTAISMRMKRDDCDSLAVSKAAKNSCYEEFSSSGLQSNKAPITLVILKRFQSFLAPVLPPNFGYAVIEDQTGRVLYHSDESRVLLENFYAETEWNEEIRTAVNHRLDMVETAEYMGNHQKFFVSPIKGLPWTLAVFYEKSFVDTLIFDMELASIVETGIYILYLFVVSLSVSILVSNIRWGWIWPEPGYMARYRALLFILPFVTFVNWTLLKTSRFWEENDSIGGGVILGEASCRNQVFGILKIGFVG